MGILAIYLLRHPVLTQDGTCCWGVKTARPSFGLCRSKDRTCQGFGRIPISGLGRIFQGLSRLARNLEVCSTRSRVCTGHVLARKSGVGILARVRDCTQELFLGVCCGHVPHGW